MIYIEKNTQNNFVLTLSENSRLTNPFFLFLFQNEYQLDASPILWTAPDTSHYTNRYNQFNLIESATGSETGGTGSLNLVSGQYSYTIYEASTYSIPLSLTQSTGRVVEEGRMVVSFIGDDENHINNNTIGLTNSVYL